MEPFPRIFVKSRRLQALLIGTPGAGEDFPSGYRVDNWADVGVSKKRKDGEIPGVLKSTRRFENKHDNPDLDTSTWDYR